VAARTVKHGYKRASHDLVGTGVVRADHFSYAAQDRRFGQACPVVEQIEPSNAEVAKHVAHRIRRDDIKGSLATGRVPNTAGIGLEEAGVELDEPAAAGL
jgi:hypothetical protein